MSLSGTFSTLPPSKNISQYVRFFWLRKQISTVCRCSVIFAILLACGLVAHGRGATSGAVVARNAVIRVDATAPACGDFEVKNEHARNEPVLDLHHDDTVSWRSSKGDLEIQLAYGVNPLNLTPPYSAPNGQSTAPAVVRADSAARVYTYYASVTTPLGVCTKKLGLSVK
jgi:hypothetical protein